ncbi:MFS transporter [Lactococcus piscium]|uniref:MFS transporter permease n=1 Tax=Pseudolactococcus paracarnosus TaxID=2749962 RepID=A0A7L4WFR8_9LACT|nr:MFS transporter [Lactococcus paracarnosus]MCJ1994621.1 MFS transporter [Lactococcus paracarnosus]QDJ28313.1 MFS transporter permease [Lactococcus paracarnosus]SPC35276.1 putative efflux transporter [Lactococcus piscium]
MRKYGLIFFLVMFLIGTDTFLIAPLLPTLSTLYHINSSLSGWMVSAYAIGYALFALISGPISDGRDRKKIMIWGFVSFTVSTFLCSFASSFGLMILFRFLAGVSASFVTPQVWASIPVIVPKEKIVQMMGIASTGLAASQLLGVPIGSFLASVSWQAPFYLISASSAILLIVIIIAIPSLNMTSQLDKGKTILTTYAEVLKNKKTGQYLLAYLIFQTGNFAVLSFIGTWFAKDFGLTVSGIGSAMIVIGIGNLIGTLFGSKLINKWGLPKSLCRGLLLLILLYIVTPFATNIVMAVIMLSFVFLLNGFVFPIFMTTLQSTTVTARSTVSSLSNAAMYLGTTISGIIGGVLMTNFKGFFGIVGFTILLYIVVLYLYKKSGFFKRA